MRRRFGSRRRRGQSEGRDAPIDAAKWLARIAADASVPVGPLEAVDVQDLPESFAIVGRDPSARGKSVYVAFSPRSGGDALLAAILTGLSVGSSAKASSNEILALAPQWNVAARRRLSLLQSDLPFRIRALEASSLLDGEAVVQPDEGAHPVPADTDQIGLACRLPEERELFMRAAQGLQGLVAKHGGVVRGVEGALQLVLQARRMAELRVDDSSVQFETWLPQRSLVRLTADNLAEALDEIEAQIRKRLGDRRVRNGDDGLRARVLPLLVDAQSLRSFQAWPLAGDDPDVLDLLGIDRDGNPVVGVCRNRFGLVEWGGILDALLALRSALSLHLARQGTGFRYAMPRLVLASKEISSAARRVAGGLSLDVGLYQVRSSWSRGLELTELEAPEQPELGRPQNVAKEEPRVERPQEASQPKATLPEATLPEATLPEATLSEASPSEEGTESREDSGSRNRSRRRRRGGRGRRGSGPAESGSATEGAASSAPPEAEAPARFEEVSFFDLDDEPREGPGGGSRRRRGGRSRRRGGREPGEGGGSSETTGDSRDKSEPEGRGSRSGSDGPKPPAAGTKPESEEPEADLAFDADAELDDLLSPLPDDVPDFESDPVPVYEDDESTSGSEQVEETSQAEGLRERPRRRAAILVHADRSSLVAAVVLARDIRMVEGIWVYPQEELMTFFRSVATDLREETPIYVIGFTPSPSREVLQAATLYADRLVWFDHHEWPPEDTEEMRGILGEANLELTPGAGTCLPTILDQTVRRSRFSDKLVDLAAGRFTQHDYEKWGRVWWSRLGEFTGQPGDRRSDLEPLLAGRPSDLAKEAARVETPAPPPEVAYVASRDFRLIHFASHSLVIVDTPADLDPQLAGRVARERYEASLSLVMNEGFETLILTGEELPGRRSLDVGALVDHLGSKLPWVDVLPSGDRVARFRIDDLARQPHRLEEVIGMISTGRSILER